MNSKTLTQSNDIMLGRDLTSDDAKRYHELSATQMFFDRFIEQVAINSKDIPGNEPPLFYPTMVEFMKGYDNESEVVQLCLFRVLDTSIKIANIEDNRLIAVSCHLKAAIGKKLTECDNQKETI